MNEKLKTNFKNSEFVALLPLFHGFVKVGSFKGLLVYIMYILLHSHNALM